MAKTIHIRVTGRAEKFLEDIAARTGLTERETVAKALWLLEKACTNNVGLTVEDQVVYIFSIYPVVASAAAPA